MPRFAAALVLLLAVLLPARLWRAGLEETIWLDEVYSLVLTTHPATEVVRLTIDDAHPPLYYLALKTWLRLARLVGVEPGILWARALNLLLWALAAAAALAAGWRWLGARAGALFGWTVAGGAAAAQMAQDARSYGIAFPALLVAYLLLVDRAVAERPEGRRGAAAWTGFALAAALALWSHLLTSLALAGLAAAFLALQLRKPPEVRRRMVLGFAAATAGALALFLPWLVRVPHQVAVIEAAAPTWMTPATPVNLLLSFVYWLPFGRLGVPTVPPFSAWLPLGAATFVLPLLAAAGARLSRRRRGASGTRVGAAGAPRLAVLDAAATIGLGGTVLFVLALWLLDRAGVAHVFHGPRYPLLAAGPWAGGLAALALRASQARTGPAWLLVAPWVVAGLVGQAWAGRLESRGGLAAALAARRVSEVYVTPPELIPFFRGQLRDVRAHRIEALPCDAIERSDLRRHAVVLDLDPWPAIERPVERLSRRVIAGGLLAERTVPEAIAPGRLDATLYRLARLRPEWYRSLCRTGFRLGGPAVPAGAEAVAFPHGQNPADGWGDLEIGPDLLPWRWGVKQEVSIRFAGRLAPGDHLLHLLGARRPFPDEEVTIIGRLAPAGVEMRARVGPGPFHLALPIHLDAPLRDPVLRVRHPLWSPAERLGAADPRRLSFQLHGAWLEPAPPPPPALY